jgi:6-phosphogluconolactonase
VEHGVAPEVRVYPSFAAASRAAASRVAAQARTAVRARGRFDWVLAGGHTPEAIYRRLARQYRSTFPWAETHLYFGDERCVGPRATESNYAMVRRSLLDSVPIPPAQVHRMRGELRPPSAAARAYARAIGSLAEGPRFDEVLLGVGPDGHTASLFPGSPALRERHRPVVAVRRSGQPPFVPRLTLTLPALASSREVLFLVSGAEKSAVVRQVVRSFPAGNLRWPASRVRAQGLTRWYLDAAAASAVPRSLRN